MNAEIDLKTVGVYLILPILISTVLLMERGSFIIIAIVQLLLMVIQVLIALIKTIIYAFNNGPFPEVLKQYWFVIVIYILCGVVGGLALHYLELDEEVITDAALIHFALAWVVILYHFKHIILLKI